MERLNFGIAVILAGLAGYGMGALSVPMPTNVVAAAPAQVQPAAESVAPAPQVANVAPSKPAPAPSRPAPRAKAPPKKEVVLPPPPDIKAPLLNQMPRMGNADAPVVVLVVSDFQCPVCKRAGAPMKEIVEELGGDMVMYFVQNPLKMHRKALGAAKASSAAHAQGKFWEYHDLLFANMKNLTRPDLEKYADQIGLNMAAFRQALDTGAHRAQVAADVNDARRIGVSGTPSVYLNSRKYQGPRGYPVDGLEAVTSVRDRAPDDDAHRIVEIRAAHLVFDGDGQFVCFGHRPRTLLY